jgi:hypothetical protein
VTCELMWSRGMGRGVPPAPADAAAAATAVALPRSCASPGVGADRGGAGGAARRGTPQAPPRGPTRQRWGAAAVAATRASGHAGTRPPTATSFTASLTLSRRGLAGAAAEEV